MILNLNNKIVSNNTHNENMTQKKWAVFTYSGKYITAVTNLFKNPNIQIALRTDNITKYVINPLKTEFLLNNIYSFSSYFTGNTLRLRYKAQPENAV
jgi:hypothetical protein